MAGKAESAYVVTIVPVAAGGDGDSWQGVGAGSLLVGNVGPRNKVGFAFLAPYPLVVAPAAVVREIEPAGVYYQPLEDHHQAKSTCWPDEVMEWGGIDDCYSTLMIRSKKFTEYEEQMVYQLDPDTPVFIKNMEDLETGRVLGGEKKSPAAAYGSWLAGRLNLPAMATLAASSAALGVVMNAGNNPAVCFAFFAVFLAAIASVTLSLRGI